MSGSWADGRMTGVDFEATGVDVETDRIVTATVVHVAPGREPAVTEWLVAVDIDIPAAATEVHKITTEFAREHGRPAAEVVAEVGEELRRGWTAGGIVVGHNIGGYDLNLLDRETRRWLDRPFAVTGPVADSLALDHAVDRYRRGRRNLTAACEHYGVDGGTAHEATSDVFASLRICWRICRQYPEVGAMTGRELWTYQVRAYREWADHFQDYKRAKLRDEGASVDQVEAFVIPNVWPVREPAITAAATEEKEPVS